MQTPTLDWEHVIPNRAALAAVDTPDGGGIFLMLQHDAAFGWRWYIKGSPQRHGLYSNSQLVADSRHLGEGLYYHDFSEAAIACENYYKRELS